MNMVSPNEQMYHIKQSGKVCFIKQENKCIPVDLEAPVVPVVLSLLTAPEKHNQIQTISVLFCNIFHYSTI